MTEQDPVTLLKESLKLSTVVTRYTELKRRGSRLSGLCPVHGERSPSFYVDDQKGLYHCFGCGIGGDLIQFVIDIERMSFLEALDFLAELAGIELPKRRHGGPSRDVIESLRAINQAALDHYHQQLKKHLPAGNYLRERGLTDNTIQLFKLGYAGQQWDSLFLALKSQFEPNLLMQSGLFKMGRNGTPYDLFRDRVIFPIHDAFGHVIAFGGRFIAQQEGPKYINSPESPLYVKGKHLYNLNFAKPFLKRAPEVVVVEGYMDAIQVYQAGIGGVIASLGTAFTAEQVKLLKRYAEKVYLNFDSDKAGLKAARASLETCLGQDLETRVVSLPERQDPDQFIHEHGVSSYREQLSQAGDFFDFLLQTQGEVDYHQDPRARSLIVNDICRTLMAITDPVVRSFYVDKLCEEMGLTRHLVERVLRDLNRSTSDTQTPPAQVEQPQSKRLRHIAFNKIEQQFLYQVMHHPNFSDYIAEEQRSVLPTVLQNVFQDRTWVLDFIGSDHSIDFNRQLELVPEESQVQLRDIYFNEALAVVNLEQLPVLFTELLRQMLRKLIDINTQRKRSCSPHDGERRRQLARQIQQFTREFHKLEH